MRNIVILNSLHFSYPLPILMRVSYNTLIVKQNTSDYYKYKGLFVSGCREPLVIFRLLNGFNDWQYIYIGCLNGSI
jgi:hypothetical protein